MRYLLSILILFACGREPNTPGQSNLADVYASSIQTTVDYIHRCDKLVFSQMRSIWSDVEPSIDYFYYDSMLHRDGEICYPDHSQSEISFDGLFATLINGLFKNNENVDIVERVGSERYWWFGPGRADLVYLPQMKVLINYIRGDATSGALLDVLGIKMFDVPEGFREQLVVMYFLMRWKKEGRLSSGELRNLNQLESWSARAMRCRFDMYDCTLVKNWLTEVVEYGILESREKPRGLGWGSAPPVFEFEYVYWLMYEAL